MEGKWVRTYQSAMVLSQDVGRFCHVRNEGIAVSDVRVTGTRSEAFWRHTRSEIGDRWRMECLCKWVSESVFWCNESDTESVRGCCYEETAHLQPTAQPGCSTCWLLEQKPCFPCSRCCRLTFAVVKKVRKSLTDRVSHTRTKLHWSWQLQQVQQ